LRRLDTAEQTRYTGDFWEASDRLINQDEQAERQGQLHELDVKLKEATIANFESQKRGERAPLNEIARTSAEKKILETRLQAESSAKHAPPIPILQGGDKRIRRAPVHFRDT
jgi:hypothetical protein